ncbi:NAD(P)/FAD-dependent oxidoreductase [Mycolicibacter virginiensis]|uniref:NAD(P)/FAD-dependent oxidoreductase n=1 Tax=Mycolicibacter virginiensis TaxID=1795032 RepID=UPI001F04C52B|nr:NAD(P)/FAD-dependent oxidoreductase [Mycolicibacter virginiensis]ULP48037.1 FAD-dependent monooxygenase [Mycolicibacter virginiensis]
MESFDVVVVGARCAGSALAIYLARAGMRVCLVDKATFPSETPSTHVIQPRGVAVLAELGALDPVLAHGASQLDSFSMVIDDVSLDGVLGETFPHLGLNVRRIVLDHALLQVAVDVGVDVRTGCRVTGTRTEGLRVNGIDTVNGPIGAGLLVGADGRGSVVAKSVGAREYLAKPGGRIPVWGYFATGPQEPRLRIGRRGNFSFLASPTDSGLYMAAVGVDHREIAAFNRDREANYRKALRQWPELHSIVGDTDRDGPLRVMANWHSYFRESAGPGWALVGDAGHFKDFSPGQGISDALCQAKALSIAVGSSVGSAAAQDAALKRWWKQRDRSSYDMYWFAMQMAPPGPPSALTAEVIRRIAADPDGATTLLKVMNRDLPTAKLFTPPRLLAASLATLRNQPDQRRAIFAEIGTQMSAEIDKLRARLGSRPAERPLNVVSKTKG